MKVLFWGTPEFSIPCLNAIHESTHQLVGVVTQPDKRRGRGNKISSSPVKIRANELGIKNIYTPQNIKVEQEIKDEITKLNADIYVVVAFGQILPVDVLGEPKYGCWNCHASLLPRWRGAAPIQWSLLSGDQKTGVGIMLMEKGLDTGPVLDWKKIKITLTDNHEILSEKLSLISSELLIKALKISLSSLYFLTPNENPLNSPLLSKKVN